MLLPTEKEVAFFSRIFFLERLYKVLLSEEHKEKCLEKEPAGREEF